MQSRGLKELLPTLRSDGREVTCSVDDFLKLIPRVLLPAHVDQDWYISQYPEVRDGIAQGKVASAADHYYKHGFIEGRLAQEPVVDEAWYLAKYPDVQADIRSGKLKNAREHYIL